MFIPKPSWDVYRFQPQMPKSMNKNLENQIMRSIPKILRRDIVAFSAN